MSKVIFYKKTRAEAIHHLRPTSTFCMSGDVITDWHDESTEPPTEEEIQAVMDEYESEWRTTEYQRRRYNEYPPIEQLADALYHQSNGDNSKMEAYLAACEAVKQKYPKGDE